MSDMCVRTRRVATTRGSTRVERYFAPLPRSSGFPPWVVPLGLSPSLGFLSYPGARDAHVPFPLVDRVGFPPWRWETSGGLIAAPSWRRGRWPVATSQCGLEPMLGSSARLDRDRELELGLVTEPVPCSDGIRNSHPLVDTIILGADASCLNQWLALECS